MHLVPVAGVDSGKAKIFPSTRSLRSLEAQRKPAFFIEFLCVLCVLCGEASDPESTT
jgi:hypothetical protein